MSHLEPAEQHVQEPSPPESQRVEPAKCSKLPDFRPLGTIRDYFTEQMKQDSIR